MTWRKSNVLPGFGLAALCVLLGIGTGCDGLVGDDEPLVAEFREVGESPDAGSYPSFVDAPGAVGTVEIGGDNRESLTPRFPGRIYFEVNLPAAAFFEFSPALIMVQDVRRARVEFRVLLSEGGDTEEVYSETLRADVANRWHDRELDLSRWAGRDVRLTLETLAVPPRGDPLWADRVQTVWGNPVLGSRPAKVVVARGEVVLGETLDWIAGQLETSGVPPERQTLTLRFALNLLLGGLLSLAIRELYKRFSRVPSGRDSFANTLPLFTVATITVISVVQYSPALALGLVGALSVIRFRTAIASPEELTYLLLCVGLGVAIGANHVVLAAATVAVVSPFIVLRRTISGNTAEDPLVLTVAADPSGFFGGDEQSVIDVVRGLTRQMTVERLDRGAERVLLRARISVDSESQLLDLLTTLRARVSECQVSSPETDPS